MIQKILIDRLAPREAFGRAIQDLMRCARRAATLREIKALPPASGNATSDPYAIKPCSLRRHASHCPALLAAVVAVGMKGDIPGSSAAIARLPKLVITSQLSRGREVEIRHQKGTVGASCGSEVIDERAIHGAGSRQYLEVIARTCRKHNSWLEKVIAVPEQLRAAKGESEIAEVLAQQRSHCHTGFIHS